jgi:soluble lytic murein transglycosylase-like protein
VPGGQRRVAAWLVVAAFVAGLGPDPVAAADPTHPADDPAVRDAQEQEATTRRELDASRRDRDGAQVVLGEAEATVARAAADLTATEDRLRDASTRLAAIGDDLAAAEDAHAEAERAEADALDHLLDVDEQLAVLLDDHGALRTQLDRKAAHAFKHGGALPQDVFVRGVTGAGDWHHVAVTLQTVERLVTEDRDLVDRTAATTRRTAPLRAEAALARRTAVDAAAAAARHAADVAALAARQAAVTADLEGEQRHHATVLERFERDADAQAALVATLDAEVADLAREADRRAAEVEAAREDARRRERERREQEERRREQERQQAEQRRAAAARAAGATGEAGPRRVDSPDVRVPSADLPPDGPAPAWTARLPEAGRRWAPAIEATAARHGLDGRLLAALVWTESNFRPDVVSHAGAIGLAQLMPGTARGLGVDPWDPRQNLDGGARYLRAQLDRFGSADLALAAYNAGPGRVKGAIPNITETRLYVVRVLERYRGLAG